MAHSQVRPSLLAATPGLRSRAGALGKAAVYLVIAFLAALLVSAALKSVTGRTLQGLMQSDPTDALLAHAGLWLALVAIPTAISLRLWKEPLAVSGWAVKDGARLAALGLAGGAALMSLIVAGLWSAGAWSAAPGAVPVGQMAGMVLLSALLWLAQAAHEEGLHRGYAFVQLSRALSFWPAAVILSLWFVWGHVGHPGATAVSLAVAGLFALVLAWSLLRTGSLWFALGFHASWNFTQSFVFGLPNSGGVSPTALMVSQLEGPALLTGGGAGPEGSLPGFAAVVALAVFVRFGLPRRDS